MPHYHHPIPPGENPGNNLEGPNIHQTLHNLNNSFFYSLQAVEFWNRKTLFFCSLCAVPHPCPEARTGFRRERAQGDGQRRGKEGWQGAGNGCQFIFKNYLAMICSSHFCPTTVLWLNQPHFSGEETEILERLSNTLHVCLLCWHCLVFHQEGLGPKPGLHMPHQRSFWIASSRQTELLAIFHSRLSPTHLHTLLHLLPMISTCQHPRHHSFSANPFLITLGNSGLPSPNPQGMPLPHTAFPIPLCSKVMLRSDHPYQTANSSNPWTLSFFCL